MNDAPVRLGMSYRYHNTGVAKLLDCPEAAFDLGRQRQKSQRSYRLLTNFSAFFGKVGP